MDAHNKRAQLGWTLTSGMLAGLTLVVLAQSNRIDSMLLWVLAACAVGTGLCAVLSAGASVGTALLKVGAAWAVGVFLVIAFLPVGSGMASAKRTSCRANLIQIARAMQMYAEEHDARLPLAGSWYTDTTPFLERLEYSPSSSGLSGAYFPCPSAKGPWTYAMNAQASGLPTTEDLADVVLMFEAAPRLPDASGGPEWVVFRHEGKANFVDCEGSTRSRGNQQVAMRWNP